MALLLSLLPFALWAAELPPRIITAPNAPALERYAARELQRYLYQISGTRPEITSEPHDGRSPCFVIGRPHSNPLIKHLSAHGHFDVSPKNPGPQGYVLKKIQMNGQPLIAIAGSDEPGCLYGVYGLLEEHYGVGFYLGGDVLPEMQAALVWPEVDERKSPVMAIRGVLPWSNFPQSPTSYSWEDWCFILDQAAKMRFNFILIHNYNGERGHNEMFHNFSIGGVMSRVSMSTARSGHGWHGKGWEINEYRFGAADLFDDYDFGADCTLHNESLNNEEVFRKGASLFQKVIDRAHSRGIKIGLGIDIDIIPADYGLKAHDPEVIEARARQIATDYPHLDYLFCFQSEYPEKKPEFQAAWRRTFMGFYEALKRSAPGIRLAASGWGLHSDAVATLPPDVIAAPIAKYSAGFEGGAAYGNREYWGCPWLERDFNSSQYYYPYNVPLSETIASYRQRAGNMKGLFALTWRLTDAVEPKLSYISQSPWDAGDNLRSSRAVYQRYARLNYGPEIANDIVNIIDENEPFACNAGECEGTPPFSPNMRRPSSGWLKRTVNDAAKADQQLAVIDRWFKATASPTHRERLRLLRCRVAAARDHIELNAAFQNYGWADLPGRIPSWIENFTHRVADISSLGNVVSTQNRYIQIPYSLHEQKLRRLQTIPAPDHVSARGTKDGAVVRWRKTEIVSTGFHVYRNAEQLTREPLPPDTNEYRDITNGAFHYTVSVVAKNGSESVRSVPSHCRAGNADTIPPRIIVVSPPTSATLGQPVWIKARLLDQRDNSSLSASLHYRAPGQILWRQKPMPRRARAVFAVEVPGHEITADGLEYFIEANDGDNRARFPASAPAQPFSLIAEDFATTHMPEPPRAVSVNASELKWSSADNAFWYRIYRGSEPDFRPGPENFLTYVHKDTTHFTDGAENFDGWKLAGPVYYRISTVSRGGRESAATPSVLVRRPTPEVTTTSNP